MRARIIQQQRRPGVTLVELLVAIAVFGILTGMVLIMIRGAKHDSDVAATQSTITKIHSAFEQKFEEYLTHPMPVQIPESAFSINPTTGQRDLSARGVAVARLMAMRDLMRMELPDRVGDVMADPIDIRIGTEIRRAPIPAALRSIRNTVNAIPRPLPGTGTDTNNPPVFWETNNSNAELLYLSVAQLTFNGESALDAFQPGEIADTDNDGLKEFIDAWGQPIQWIRWPAGYALSPSLNWNGVPFGLDEAVDTFVSDPLDPLRCDLAWNDGVGPGPGSGLFPLIFSVGINRLSGMVTNTENWPTGAQWNDPMFTVSHVPLSGNMYYPDPYYPRGSNLSQPDASLGPKKLGFILFPAVADDNVTNFDSFGASL